MCKPFPSLWKKPLYILKEKHPFPGRAQNIYQAEGKKKGIKKTLFFFPGVKNLFENELCILNWKLVYRSNI